MSKAHKHDPKRPAKRSMMFDKSSDAKTGLHICKHCDKTLCDWFSLRKHIQEKRCPVLFGNHEKQHTGTTMGAKEPAPENEAN